MTLFLAEVEARACILVVHGLNTKPEAMDDIIAALTGAGYHCLRVSLYPNRHGTRFLPPREVVEDWQRSLRTASWTLTTRFPDLPCSAVAYSLGAMVVLASLGGGADYQRLVLWAPPLSLTRAARLVRILAPLRRLGMDLPSAAPAVVRQRPSTPLSEYAGLLRLVGCVEAISRVTLDRQPVLVIVDPRDELVSIRGVQAWVVQRQLVNWRVEEVHGRSPVRRTYRHHLVSEKALGALAWERAIAQMLRHLDGAHSASP